MKFTTNSTVEGIILSVRNEIDLLFLTDFVIRVHAQCTVDRYRLTVLNFELVYTYDTSLTPITL